MPMTGHGLRSTMAAILGLICACGGGGTSGGGDTGGPDGIPGGLIVETEVSAHQVEVGAKLKVICRVTQDGLTVQAATDFIVGGTTGYVVDGDWLSFDQEGSFTVACRAPDLGVTDATPETVEVGGDRAVAIDTILDPDSIAAGSATTVTCTATDVDGNPRVRIFNLIFPHLVEYPRSWSGGQTTFFRHPGR